MIQLMDEYVSLMEEWPESAGEVVEQLVQVATIYNSMSCQLVLGAGSVGLQMIQSITAKVIAISCSTINLLILCMTKLAERHPYSSADRMPILLKDMDNHN